MNKAVLDSGASKTVAGEDWYTCFLESLDDTDRSTVKELNSNKNWRRTNAPRSPCC